MTVTVTVMEPACKADAVEAQRASRIINGLYNACHIKAMRAILKEIGRPAWIWASRNQLFAAIITARQDASMLNPKRDAELAENLKKAIDRWV